MITMNERQHLFDAARQRFTGEGAIIDLGTWLGGSTAAMAAGLSANTNDVGRHRVHAFDLFRMNAWMKENYRYPELADIPVGGSFRPVFEKNLRPWADRVVVHAGDLSEHPWSGGPVELVHVDIMKNWALTNTVLRTIFKHLIPGRSIIVHQDYAHFNTVWIHLVMYRLRAHFEPIALVPDSTSYEFRSVSAIPPSLLDHTYGFADFDREEERAAFAWSRALVSDPFKALNIDAAEASLYLQKGDLATAEALLTAGLAKEEAYKASHPQEHRRSELILVKQRLEKARNGA